MNVRLVVRQNTKNTVPDHSMRRYYDVSAPTVVWNHVRGHVITWLIGRIVRGQVLLRFYWIYSIKSLNVLVVYVRYSDEFATLYIQPPLTTRVNA